MLFWLLASYGLVFAIQNKLPHEFITSRVAFLDSMVKCSFCLGFHTGWLTYLAWQPWSWNLLWTLPLAGLASAAFSYGFDMALLRLEGKDG